MGTKRDPGTFDCYTKAELDEPMFVLLARDRMAPELVLRWAAERERVDENPAIVAEARDCAAEMHRWWIEHRS